MLQSPHALVDGAASRQNQHRSSAALGAAGGDQVQPIQIRKTQIHDESIVSALAKVVIYEAFVEGKLEAPKHLTPDCARSLPGTEVRGVSTGDDLQSLERLYLSAQGTGTDSAIQGNGQTGRVPGDAVLAIALRPAMGR